MKYLISEKLIELIQVRIHEEQISSYIYEAMANYLGNRGFTGAAKLWNSYSKEELIHKGWGVSLLNDLDILPETRAIPAQSEIYAGLVDIINKSYEHEVLIAQQCNELFTTALEEGCGMVTQLALKYQAEQVEDIGKMTYWLDRLEAFGDNPTELRLLDNEMGG